MIVLWPYYALFYRIQIECPKPFYMAFLSHFFIQTIKCFVRQILREKLRIPDKQVQDCTTEAIERQEDCKDICMNACDIPAICLRYD